MACAKGAKCARGALVMEYLPLSTTAQPLLRPNRLPAKSESGPISPCLGRSGVEPAGEQAESSSICGVSQQSCGKESHGGIAVDQTIDLE